MTNTLSKGFYTLGEASRLIGVSQQKIRGWLQGYPGSVGSIIKRDYGKTASAHYHEMSFLDLMEARLINLYRSKGVSLQVLREVAEKAREDFQQKHPFAEYDKFKTDGKRMFLEFINENTKEKGLINYLSEQNEMPKIIERTLLNDTELDETTKLAKRWRCGLKYKCNNVFADPKFAYGNPVAYADGEAAYPVPTSTLYNQWLAEEEDFTAVAHWYEIKPSLVKQAVKFEKKRMLH